MHAGIWLPAITQHKTPLLTVLYLQPTHDFLGGGQVWQTLTKGRKYSSKAL